MFKPVKSDVSGNIEVTADMSSLMGQTLMREEGLACKTTTIPFDMHRPILFCLFVSEATEEV